MGGKTFLCIFKGICPVYLQWCLGPKALAHGLVLGLDLAEKVYSFKSNPSFTYTFQPGSTYLPQKSGHMGSLPTNNKEPSGSEAFTHKLCSTSHSLSRAYANGRQILHRHCNTWGSFARRRKETIKISLRVSPLSLYQ